MDNWRDAVCVFCCAFGFTDVGCVVCCMEVEFREECICFAKFMVTCVAFRVWFR